MAFRVPKSVLVWLTSLLALCGRVHAQQLDRQLVSIDWRAPSTCPERAQVEGDVIRLLGGATQDGSEVEPFVARAEVDQQADGRWHVVLSTWKEGRPGTRELTAESCAALASATALIVAMMIDPEAMMGLDESASEHEPTSTPEASTSTGVPKRAPEASTSTGMPKPTPGRAPRSAPSTRSTSWRGFAGPVLATHTGLAPRWPLAGGVRLGLRSGRSQVALEGLVSSKTVGQSEEDSALRGKFALLTASLRGCQTSAGRVVRWGGCIGADLHRLHAVGNAAAPLHNRTQTGWFWTVAGGGLLVVRASAHVAFPVLLEALLPTSRPDFEFTGMSTVHQPALVAGRASFATELSFP